MCLSIDSCCCSEARVEDTTRETGTSLGEEIVNQAQNSLHEDISTLTTPRGASTPSLQSSSACTVSGRLLACVHNPQRLTQWFSSELLYFKLLLTVTVLNSTSKLIKFFSENDALLLLRIVYLQLNSESEQGYRKGN